MKRRACFSSVEMWLADTGTYLFPLSKWVLKYLRPSNEKLLQNSEYFHTLRRYCNGTRFLTHIIFLNIMIF